MRITMRRLLLATAIALLLAPAASAVGLPRVSQCVELGCVQLQDNDEDGSYEWANAAFSIGPAAALNANRDANATLVEAIVTTEETLDPYHTVSTIVYANTTDDGAREAWVFATLLEGDEGTGAQGQLAALLVELGLP